MKPLDEKALRKETFREGVPIRLADGQEWTFAKPYLELRLDFSSGEPRFPEVGVPTFGPGYWELFEEFLAENDPSMQVLIIARLAIYILRINYNLTDGDLARLLAYRDGDDDNAEMWQSIADVAQGRGPKPSPAI